MAAPARRGEPGFFTRSAWLEGERRACKTDTLQYKSGGRKNTHAPRLEAGLSARDNLSPPRPSARAKGLSAATRVFSRANAPFPLPRLFSNGARVSAPPGPAPLSPRPAVSAFQGGVRHPVDVSPCHRARVQRRPLWRASRPSPPRRPSGRCPSRGRQMSMREPFLSSAVVSTTSFKSYLLRLT